MKNKISFFLFFLFAYVVAGPAVDAEFQTTPSFPEYHFYTDVSVDADFVCNVDPGDIIEGPSRRSGVDICADFFTVCPGTEVSVTPDASGIWGRTRQDIYSLFPVCGTGSSYCSHPVDFVGSVRSHAVTWIPGSLFDEYSVDTGGYARSFSDPSEAHYDALRAPFYHINVDYRRLESGGYVEHPDSSGYGDVLCKGTVNLYRDGVLVRSFDAASSDSAAVVLNSEGVHQLRTELTNVECFAALVKDPLDYGVPGWFSIFYFGYNPPSFSRDIFERVITVESRVCSVEYTESTEIPYLDQGETAQTTATVTNDGDVPATVSLLGTSYGYSAVPFDVDVCITLFGREMCIPVNGFESPIEPGASRDLHVSITRTDRVAATCPSLWLDYECESGSCGGEGSGTIEFPLECSRIPPVDTSPYCEIEPDRKDIGQGEIHTFGVTCYNADGIERVCPGNDWSFGGAIDAEFYRPPTNEQAMVRSDSPVGTRGTLDYDCGPGCSACHANLTVVPPRLDCEIDPPSADLDVGDVQDFDILCTYDRRDITPDDADWSLEDIDGTLVDHGTDGATFTATRSDSGDIVVLVTYRDVMIEDSAPITVGGGGDALFYCEIYPPSATMFVGESEDFDIICYFDDEIIEPGFIEWTLGDGLVGRLTDLGVDGATFTSTIISHGDIVAKIEYGELHATASAPITVFSADLEMRCDIVPSEATLYIGESEDFDLNCSIGDTPFIPEYAEWHLAGIPGILEDDGIDGSTFTGTIVGDGTILAKVEYRETHFLPTATLHVLNETGDENETDDDDDDDDTMWCVVSPAYINDSSLTVHRLIVRCGPPDARRVCTSEDGVGWGTNDPTVVSIFDDEYLDYIYKRIQLIGDTGDTAEVYAYVDDDPTHRCTTDVEIYPQVCLEYT